MRGHGSRNVAAIHWQLPFAALYGKIPAQAKSLCHPYFRRWHPYFHGFERVEGP